MLLSSPIELSRQIKTLPNIFHPRLCYAWIQIPSIFIKLENYVYEISHGYTIGCRVLHILQQIITPLWELILYAIILSLVDFQSFPI